VASRIHLLPETQSKGWELNRGLGLIGQPLIFHKEKSMKKVLASLVLLLGLTAASYAQTGGIKDQNLSPELYRTVHDGLRVYNGTGSSIAAGALVYVCGWTETSGGAVYRAPNVCLADNEAHVAGFVARSAIANGYVGSVFKDYRLGTQDTSGLTVGDPVYLSSTAGGWTSTKPVSGVVQIVGRVSVVSSTVGFVEVDLESEVAPESANAFYYKDSFLSDVLCVQNDGTACSGVDTEINLLSDSVLVLNQSNIGTQTITKPVFSASGLEIGLDKTNTEGAEYNLGATARSPGACVIGTDACYVLAKATITTVAGLTEFAVGFRNDGAYAPAIDNYTDMAVLNANAGTINIETIDDNGATTTTDTEDAWADGETHTFGVYISAAGVVTYTIDGAAPPPTAAHTIDSGDVVVPFVYAIQSATTSAVNLVYLEGGRQ
jgi:hypothetical protein